MPTTTMTCPSCGGALTELDRSGVRIDACRSCRGVWLDRGELDKIIERSAIESAPPPAPRGQPHAPPQPYYGHDDRYRHKRKKSFLEDLFD